MKEEINDQKSKRHNKKIGIGIAVGIPIGTAIGLAMDSLPLGVAIGVSIGIALGVALNDSQSFNENRSRLLMITLVILGLLMFIGIVVYFLVSHR